MGNSDRTEPVIRFHDFQVNLETGELWKAGVRLKLQDQPFKVLTTLLQRPGQVVTREELRKLIWPEESFGDFDHAINLAIAKLRATLGDSADVPHLIETLPRRGYRFIGTTEGHNKERGAAETVSTVPPTVQLSTKSIGLGLGILASAIALLFAFKIGGWGDRLLGPAAAPRIQSLVVLPLENLSHDPQQEYFADGMTDELITNLGKVGSLRVISRTSAMHYKGTQKLLPEIAQELGVDAVIEGTVQRSGNKVRITTQLLRAKPEMHLWGESYERDTQDILALQSEVAQAIVNEIRIKVTSGEQARLKSARPVSPEAYEAYLRGRHFWDSDFGGLEYFEMATQLDPSFARAYGGIALYYTVQGFSRPPREVYPKATEAAMKALQIDPELAEAHAALGYTKLNFEWDWAGAEREFRKAVELDPGSSDAHWMFAVYLTAMTRFDEALSEAKRAHQLDPFSPVINDLLGWVLMYARRYDEAITQFKSTLELAPEYRRSHSWLAVSYTFRGMYPEAYREFNALGAPSGDPSLGYLYAVTGKKKEALKAAETLKRTAQHEYVDPYSLAIVYSGLGDNDEAFGWLEKAFADRSANMPQMKIDLFFDPLRSDPRFQNLLHRVNLPN